MTGSTNPVAAKASLRPSALTTAYALALTVWCWATIVTPFPTPYLRDALFWVPLIALASLWSLSTLPEVEVGTTLGPIAIVAAAILFPPSAVALFAFLGFLHMRELRREAPLVMSLFNRSMHGLAGAGAALGASGVYAVAGQGSWQILPASLVAVVIFDVVNTLLLVPMLVIRRRRTWRVALAESANPFPRFTLNATVSAMLSLLIVVLVRDVGAWSVVLVGIPLWLSHSAQRSAREAQDRAEQLAVRVRELEMLNRLSSDLLSVRAASAVGAVAESVLRSAGDFGQVSLATDGAASAAGHTVPIIGAEPAAIVVAEEIDGPTRDGLEAAASLIGLTWSRLELEAELAETERARTALTGQILEEGTHERSRIAMSVHDDVLPLFAAAQMQIDSAQMLIEMGDLERADATIEEATAGVSDGIRALRDTLEDLKQSTLVPGTVIDGVRKLLADLQARTGIRTTLVADDELDGLPFAVELLAYETVRGCLANVEKHAHATKVQVEFRAGGGTLVVHMRDDGRGFDATQVGARSHGLALMRQRAELSRGSFDISGVPGEGTTVRLEVPTW